MSDGLVRVVGPRFVAGLVVRGGRVAECAPYLRRALSGLGGELARTRALQRGWRWEHLGPDPLTN